MTTQRITSVLVIDCGEGRSDGNGRYRYTRQPTAHYDCHLCHTTEGPVTGPERVREFVARIRTDHPTYCPATTTRGAQAA